LETWLPKLSANLTFLFNEIPFEQRFEAAADAGFESVECMFPYDLGAERTAELLGRHHLRMDLFNLPAGDFAAGERGVAVFPDRVAEFRDGVARALDMAAHLGTSKLNCLVGLRDAASGEDEQYRCLVDNLTWAAEEIGARGVTLHIEPLCAAEVPGFFLDSVALAERILDDVASPHLKLQFDVFHVQRGRGDVVASLRASIDRIGHVQVADSPDRGAPGSGELNFNYVFAELDRLGYAGRVGLEYRPGGSTAESLTWLISNGWHGAVAARS
jgi:hydroxypyruvate isomerase